MNIPINKPILVIVWHYYSPAVSTLEWDTRIIFGKTDMFQKWVTSWPKMLVAGDYLYNRLTGERVAEMRCI